MTHSRRRLLITAGIGAALTATAVAGGWYWWQNDSPGHAQVATAMPSGPPVYVRPECTLTQVNSFRDGPDGGWGGRIPAGFTPVRAVRCSEYGDGKSETKTQLELRDPAALSSLVAAYHTTAIGGHKDPERICAAYADADPDIALVDAHGTAIWPGAPRDECHHVIAAVKQATASNDGWIVTGSAVIH